MMFPRNTVVLEISLNTDDPRKNKESTAVGKAEKVSVAKLEKQTKAIGLVYKDYDACFCVKWH